MCFTSAESRWRDVRLAAAARGISTCGDFLAATALALALQTAGAGGLAVSGLMIASAVPLVLLAPMAGRLADRVDSRTLLVCVGLAQAVICVVLAYARHPVLIMPLVALLASGLAVSQPTLAALVPAMVGAEDLPRASAINQTAGTLGVLAGPALAGLLVGQFGVRPPLLIDAGSYLALVVAGLLLTTRRGGVRNRDRTSTNRAQGVRPAWRLRRDPLLTTVVAGTAAVIAAVGAINVVEVFYVRETLHSSTTMYGVVTGAWTAGILAGTWVFAPLARRWHHDGVLVCATLTALGACSLAVLAAAAVPTAAALIPLWLVGGLFNGGDNVFSSVVIGRRVPEAARGRAFAALGAAVQGAGMAGYLAGGALLEAFDPRPLVAVCGIAGLAVAVAAVLPVARAVRRERAVERVSRTYADAGPATAKVVR